MTNNIRSPRRFGIFLVFSLLALIDVAIAQPPITKDDSAEAVVSALYRDYAWEVVFRRSRYIELADQSKQELEKYFSSALAELIVKDRKCGEQTHDICRLDFDLIYASQDRGAVHELDIQRVNPSAEVKVSFGNAYKAPRVELSFKMIQTPKGWRIDDIDYGRGRTNLRAVLVGPKGSATTNKMDRKP